MKLNNESKKLQDIISWRQLCCWVDSCLRNFIKPLVLFSFFIVMISENYIWYYLLWTFVSHLKFTLGSCILELNVLAQWSEDARSVVQYPFVLCGIWTFAPCLFGIKKKKIQSGFYDSESSLVKISFFFFEGMIMICVQGLRQCLNFMDSLLLKC